MAAPAKPQVTDIVDEMLDLPSGKEHLCSCYGDGGALIQGKIRFVLNREVLDHYRDIIDALEIARGLPDEAHPANIQLSDPLVLHILTTDPEVKTLTDDEARQVARQKAAGFYQKQKAQVQSDAMFIAMSLYNEIDMVPIPYRPGEIAFSTSEDRPRSRELPAWLKTKTNTAFEFPLPERRLSNTYELRLKLLYQLSEECGVLWTMGFREIYERGMTKTLRLAEPRDEDGFSPVGIDRAVHAKSSTKSKKNVDQTGS